ncbi:MAG: 4-alpha-glucanotransferase [Solobacterium sp.]|nr:4-alpha-glucanotransferase [Solobacterium sp.]
MVRRAGILMPITSLPSEYGVGTLGQAAYDFVDFLENAGQSCWQILPIGPTGYGDSPYQSYSSFAGNPYMIDLNLLAEDGLLDEEDYADEDWGEDPAKVDYGLLYNKRFAVLRKAADRLAAKAPKDYLEFLNAEKDWLHDYAFFMAVKTDLKGKPWRSWPQELQDKNPEAMMKTRGKLFDDIAFWARVQYLFFRQYKALKKYANEKGIKIIGDLPIYVASDSIDAWSFRDQFQLDEKGSPKAVAGCPPDAFSADGQLWGNPLYDWEKMKKDDYKWWTSRIEHQMRFYDILRLDHFRGFSTYYAIPAKDTTAKNGVWHRGPGIEFFKTIEKKLGNLELIAEDLGDLSPDVFELLDATGYPGMKVLEFAFDGESSDYLPHNYGKNCVVYAGTHDNDTVLGWLKSASASVRKKAVDYFHMDTKEGWNWGMIRGAYASTAELAIVQAQDIIGLGSEGRINTPATASGNWTWRCEDGALTDAMAERLLKLAKLYNRNAPERKKTEQK